MVNFKLGNKYKRWNVQFNMNGDKKNLSPRRELRSLTVSLPVSQW